MPKALNDNKIKNLKPQASRYRVSDSNGMVLEVMPSGAKIWRFRYRLHGSQHPLLTIGDYPAIGLKAAREKAAKYAEIVARAFSS